LVPVAPTRGVCVPDDVAGGDPLFNAERKRTVRWTFRGSRLEA
jgi:hypothetical protein